ncbi:MFS transporter [Streptomyces sp. NPDC007088]|uniref:MFS transporter n=1 Tax=Streptomyces sp. NPDC007088 TaxID=3364773 RepID=UPI0036870B3C
MTTAEPKRADEAEPSRPEDRRPDAPFRRQGPGKEPGPEPESELGPEPESEHARPGDAPARGRDEEPARAEPHPVDHEPHAVNHEPDPADPADHEPAPGPAGGARSRTRTLLRHPVTVATAVAAVLHLVWFFAFANSGGDLAAQDAWAEFVGHHPDSAYNLAWYGGTHPVSYSVISPYLMHVLGVRTTMMAAGTVSAGLLALILVRSRAVRNPMAASLAGVFALLCNAASGRVTFGLGAMFGLGAVAAVFCWPHRWRERRWAKALVAAVLAGLATAASPVAGLYVGLVAVALFLSRRRPGAYALGLTPLLVVGLSSLLFPFSGTMPMSLGSASLPVISSAFVFFLVPRDWRTVRITTAVYGVGVVLSWAVSSQVGSNITRLAMLFAGVALLAALPFTVPRTRKWYTVLLAFVGVTVWIGFKAADDVVHTQPAESWAQEGELAPLLHQLRSAGAERGRVEVVPARSHREAAALAPYVNLARGWLRQADMKRNPLFYDDTLNSANYHEWLKRWAVHFVVLPKGTAEADGDGGERERELVAEGQPYLDPLWGDANWELYAVSHPVPIADPPALVQRADQGELTIQVKSPGRVLIRIPYSPWLGLVDKNGKSLKAPQETEQSKNRTDENEPKTYDNLHGCLSETAEDAFGDKWTELLAPKAGTYRLASPYQFPRGTGCPEELRPAQPEDAD